MKKFSKLLLYVIPAALVFGTSLSACGNKPSPTSTAPAHAHNYVAKHDEHHHWRECECGDVIEKAEHSFAITSTTQATCEHGQIITYKCTGCDFSYNETHGDTVSHNFVMSIVKEATCQEEGTRKFTCSECEKSYEVKYSNPSAHKWNEGLLNDGVTTYHCLNTGCDESYKVISAKTETQTNINIDTLVEIGAVELKEATIQMDSSTISGFTNDVTIGAEKVASSTVEEIVSEESKELIKNAPVFDFSIKDGEQDVHELTGKVKISIPYELQPGEDPDNISIAYITDGGDLEHIEAQYWDNQVTFETTHFSYYAVIKLEKEKACEVFGHNIFHSTTKSSTCVEHGIETYVCTRCGESFDEELPLEEHDFVYTRTVESTKTEHGFIEYKCSHCNTTKHSELPLLPETDGGFLSSLITSAFNSNLHVYEKIPNPMRTSGYDEMDISLVLEDKANPFTLLKEYGSYYDVSYSDVKCNIEQLSNGIIRYDESDNSALSIFINVVQNINAYNSSLEKVFKILENALSNFVTKRETEGQAIISLDFDKINHLLDVVENEEISVIFDTIFGNQAFDKFTNFLLDFVTNTIGQSVNYLKSKGYDVEGLIDFASAVSGMIPSHEEKGYDVERLIDFASTESGMIPSHEEVLIPEILSQTGEQLLTEMFGLPSEIVSPDGLNNMILLMKDMKVADLVEMFAGSSDPFVSLLGKIKEIIELAKTSSNFELITTKSGQFVSFTGSVSVPQYDVKAEFKVDAALNMESTKETVNDLKEKVKTLLAFKDSYKSSDSVFLKALAKYYGADRFDYGIDEYGNEHVTSSPIYGVADQPVVLDIMLDNREFYRSNYSEFVKYNNTHNLATFENSENLYTVYPFGDYNILGLYCYFVDGENLDTQLSFRLPAYKLIVDAKTGEAEVVFGSNNDEHLYIAQEISKAEYMAATGESSSPIIVSPSNSEMHYIKETCVECGAVRYEQTESRYSAAGQLRGYLCSDKLDETARNCEFYFGTLYGDEITVIDRNEPLDCKYTYLRHEANYKNKTFTFGNVTIKLEYSMQGGHACTYNEIISIYINDSLYVKTAQTIHLDYDCYTVNGPKTTQGCYDTWTVYEYCMECKHLISTYGGYESHHHYVTDQSIPTTLYFDGIEIVHCTDCNETNLEWNYCGGHNLDFRFDEATDESYYVCLDCGEKFKNYDELCCNNVTEFASTFYSDYSSSSSLVGNYLFEIGRASSRYSILESNYSVSFAICGLNGDGEPDLDNADILNANITSANRIYFYPDGGYTCFGSGYLVSINQNELNQFVQNYLTEGKAIYLCVTDPYSGYVHILQITL